MFRLDFVDNTDKIRIYTRIFRGYEYIYHPSSYMLISWIKHKTISKPTNLGISNCNQVGFKALLELILITFFFFFN